MTATSRRRAPSGPRRRYHAYAVTRSAIFGPAVLAPLAGWAYLGEPLRVGGPGAAAGHLAGLAVMLAAGLIVIPYLAVTVVLFGPDLPKMLIPRRCRAWFRNRENRFGDKKHPRGTARSAYITDRLRRLVLAADPWCVGCRRTRSEHVDHRIPWSWGGLTSLVNCFGLCGDCNLRKCDYWEGWRGRAHWGRHFSMANIGLAHRVFRRESGLRGRWNPLRMIRLAWALGT